MQGNEASDNARGERVQGVRCEGRVFGMSLKRPGCAHHCASLSIGCRRGCITASIAGRAQIKDKARNLWIFGMSYAPT